MYICIYVYQGPRSRGAKGTIAPPNNFAVNSTF